ncbi:MAG: DUF47 domain-containing protein [Bacteroidales bacterium]|nr:DUF47 domain-containing protein [Bacteroidales bacterium]
MKLDKFLQLFVVKEKRFFPLFIKQAEVTVKAATYLVEITQETDNDSRKVLAHRVKECETAGDTITDKILEELLKAFVTPFDREDIHQLASTMDAFLDIINDSAKKIAIYQPVKTDQKLIQIANYILEDTQLVKEATLHFENFRKNTAKVSELCDRIKEIEHVVDDIYESYMNYIFNNEKDVAELIKGKNIVQALEDTTDQAKDLSEDIRSIIVKMS